MEAGGEADQAFPPGGAMTFGRQHWLVSAAVVAVAAAVVAAAPAVSAQHGGAPTRWCGTPTSRDQLDTVSAFLVHVVYAVPADAPDRLSERALPILNDLASIETWWQSQDPTRSPRFDLLGGDCDTGIGQLDLSQVRLPREASYYADPRDGFTRITADLEHVPLSFDEPETKYLVYYDGPVQRKSICGTSPLGPARGNATSVVYLDSACGQDLGRAGEAASTAVHELLHSLAALPRAHPCAGNRAHACDDARDILYPTVENGSLLGRLVLDVGRDDYYALDVQAGSWWDVRNSPFLEHLDATYPRAPLGLHSLFASSHGAHVTLSWAPERVESGERFRVYREGDLLTETEKLSASDDAVPGTTILYSVRVADTCGYLSAAQTIRVLVGAGVVDEHGERIPDTVPPARVTGLRASRTGTAVTLRWSAVDDPGDLAGYRVFRDGRRFGGLRSQTWLSVSLARAHAAWSVAAVDTSGNVGRRSLPILVPVKPGRSGS